MAKKWMPYTFVAPAVIAMMLLVFYPLLNGVYLSFTNANQFNTQKTQPNGEVIEATYEWIGLQNYDRILLDDEFRDVYFFWSTLRQTLVWTFSNIVIHISLGLMLALLLNTDIKGRAMYRVLLIVPWAIPQYIAGFSWRYMFNQEYGFVNSFFESLGIGAVEWLGDADWAMVAVVVANTWVALPFNIVVFLGGLQSIPLELYEAAEVDGANALQRFLYITLPMLRPVMFVATLLGIIWTFNGFNIIYLVTNGGPVHATEILATWAWKLGFSNSPWVLGVAAAYSTIILLILLMFSFLYIMVLNRSGQGKVI